MGFDGMTHLHLSLMKFQRSFKLRGLMTHAGQLAIDKVAKNVVKGGVQSHGHTQKCHLFNYLDPTTTRPQIATAPVSPSIKLGGNGFPTKLTVSGEREVLLIVHPMVMGFDGMAHLLHLGLMKFQRSLKLRALMNHAGNFAIKKVVKNVVKGGVQVHGHTQKCHLFNWLPYLLVYKSTPHFQGKKSDFSSFLVKEVKFRPRKFLKTSIFSS